MVFATGGRRLFGRILILEGKNESLYRVHALSCSRINLPPITGLARKS
jgi:hypothetical protein